MSPIIIKFPLLRVAFCLAACSPVAAAAAADTWVEQAYAKAHNAGQSDAFGRAVALSGDTVVVGAHAEHGGEGAAYVFVRSGSGWAQQASLKPNNVEGGDGFGRSVAICGDTIVIGANGEDGDPISTSASPNNNEPGSGAAYVFVREGTSWIQQGYLKAFNADGHPLAGGDQFGISVAVSGDTALVGAWLEDGDATSTTVIPNRREFRAGAAYVFVRDGIQWSQQAYLKAFNAGQEDAFGHAVALSGDVAVVGAYGEDGDSRSSATSSNDEAEDAGAAYVFVREGSIWSRHAYLKAANVGAGDRFGESVAVSGDTIVIGAMWEDGGQFSTAASPDDAATDAGAAYVFARDGTSWDVQAYLKASNVEAGDRFGSAVSISGDAALVGSRLEDGDRDSELGSLNNCAKWAGAAYRFERSGIFWAEAAYMKASNARPNDDFGSAVAVSGDTMVVGAWKEDHDPTFPFENTGARDSGAAYIFAPLAQDIEPITSMELMPAGVEISIPMPTGRRVAVEYSPDLSAGSWTELGLFFVPNGGGIGTFFDPDPFRRANASGHYRARLLPLVEP